MTDDSLKAVRHVQEMQVIDGKDYEGIKEAVFKYGGVESSLYSTIRSSQGSSVYYNQNTSAYCYIGTEKPNHDVVIIGWDDNYSRSISILRWRETVRLSARTAGEMDLEKTEFSMCPTTIRILARIMWHIRG